MPIEERPKLTLKLEVGLPDSSGGPIRKFSVNRALKARWSQNHQGVIQDLLEEIKNYRGSFIGDMVFSLAGLVQNEDTVQTDDQKRQLEVDKWSASMIENIIYSGVKDEIYKDAAAYNEVTEWDGSVREIEPILPSELESADIDRLMILLAPKIKHALYLISKKM